MNVLLGLPPGDGRNDADLVGRFDRSLVLFEEADVFVVHEDVHEAADVSFVVADALFEAWEGAVEAGDDFADIRAAGFDDFELVGQLAKGCGDTDTRHN
jgi:hypothetical protein